MQRYPFTSFLASRLAVACYLAFTLLALARYPLVYFPTRNWLSDLGSLELNPSGAIFYNIGIISTGLLLLPFFLGLSWLKIEANRRQNLMVLVTQIFGISGAFAMILSAFFPINFFALHSFWSAALYILLGTAYGFSVAALRYHLGCPRWLLALGVLTALSAMLMGIFQSIYLVEWVTVALFLGYSLLLGIQTKRL